MKLKILVLLAMAATVLIAAPASADHDMVYAPCDPEDTRSVNERVWYIDYQSGVILRYDDPWWSERPGMMGYTNWHHQCGLGMTGVWQAAPILPQPHPPDYVIDTRNPAVVCDAANGYTRMGAVEIEQRVNALIPDGIDLNSLTITDTGIIIAGTPSPLLVEAGIIREWAIDHNGTSRHHLDLYWEYKFTHLPNETFWEAGCTTVPTPIIIATTTSTTTSTTTTQPAVEDPAPEPIPSDPEEPDPSPQPPSQVEGPNIETETSVPSLPQPTVSPDPSPAFNDDYDLFDAEWDGYPFEATIRLLEDRYPLGVQGKTYFKLSAAVEFLRAGGMVKGLDNLWDSPATQ